MGTLKAIFFLLPEFVKLVKWLSNTAEETSLHLQIKAKLNAINKAFEKTNASDRARALDDVFTGKLSDRDKI